MNLSITQQARISGQSFIIQAQERLFGVDLVFDAGDNFRAYVQEYHHVSGHTHRRVGKQQMYNHEEVMFVKAPGFDLTKREDPKYLEDLAIDVVNTYVMG
jgi:hypothetical protein